MKIKTKFHLLTAVMLALLLSLSGCTEDGSNGAAGTNGTNGTDGTDGTPGTADGNNVGITALHSRAYLQSVGEFDVTGSNPKYFANATITSTTADVAGLVTVNFTVTDADANPDASITSISANIAKLMPATVTESFNKWVPYNYRAQTVSGSASGTWPNPDGTTADQGYTDSGGTFTNNADGSYTYVFGTNLASVVTPVGAAAISYDRNLTHRVSIMMGGHAGPTADAVFDFVPDGSVVTQTRNIVETAACQNCHGDEFHGHGGNRLSVENCATCHNPSTTDPHGGETVDLKVMIHKIHAGGELASIPGVDGLVWDTGAGEATDNGEYAIWGYRNTKHDWWKVGFPAIIENCTKCHQEVVPDADPATLSEVDNWKNVPSRAACGSCHDNIDFAETNVASLAYHPGGALATDDACTNCHAPVTDVGIIPSITNAHDWTQHNEQNIPEFDVDLTVSAPANTTHFVAGESPVVSIAITPTGTINPIDHTAAFKDEAGAGAADGVKEGCPLPTPCPAADGFFDHIYLMVHGPREERSPALTTAARADIVSSTAGNFDLSAAVSLDLKADNGQDLYSSDNGGTITAGSISVAVADGTFAAIGAATPTEIVTWLNADADFTARAIAYLENTFVAIRSRNLGKFYAVQLETSDVATAVFAADTGIHVVGGYYARNDVAIRAVAANDDPKAAWTVGSINYTLDPVDDLRPGTYIASVEIADRGRIGSTNYKTPSVAKTTFQVKQEAEELAPAGNCGSCHQGPEGTGFVLDYARHNKIFDNTAIDQCGGCHDYQSQNPTGDWGGAKTINKRIHAVHRGADLTYPNLTVGHSDGIPGRNWEINFPQDIRNCETCHPATAAPGSIATSGSWKTKAARNPCSGCHDTDSAKAHLKLMTFDPTPTNPWSGDEEESCTVCH